MPGHMISFIGAKGGVGKSVVAANYAFANSIENKQKTFLIDADMKSAGDQSLITGMKLNKSLKELSAFSGSMEPRALASFISQHKMGVSFIGVPNDPLMAQAIDVDGLGRTLKTLSKIYPLTVVDLGSDLNPLALKFLEYSTLVMVVVSPDMLVLNQTKRLYSELISSMIPQEMIQFVVNQSQSSHPISTDVITKQLRKKPLALLNRDDKNTIAALARSAPLVTLSKSAPLADGVYSLVRLIKQKSILTQLEKINRKEIAKPQSSSAPLKARAGSKDPWTELKSRIHRGLVEEIDFKKQDNKDPHAQVILKEQTKRVVIDLLNKENATDVLRSKEQMNQIVKEILDEALGLGPLEDLLANTKVSEIMVVGPKKIYFEQEGKNKLSDVTFTNDHQVRQVIERIVQPIGRRIDEKTPYVDARLKDGSRVHAIIPPCAIDGCTITIRKFPENRLTYKDLVSFGSLTQEMADFLRIAVESHQNIIVSGGTGSGKTTLINVLASFIPANERIITCEDSAELDLPQEHVVRLETRPPSLEGDGEVDIRLLVKQTLRMKPDRIVVGECRGGEALDMLQAMNTGHDGSMTTIHSNSPRDAISRLETLVQYAGAGLSPKGIKEMIASAVNLVVQQQRLDDGSRRITHITEITGMEGEGISQQDIFKYTQEGVNKQGKIIGKFQATGLIPKFIEKIEKKGYKIPRGIFTNN